MTARQRYSPSKGLADYEAKQARKQVRAAKALTPGTKVRVTRDVWTPSGLLRAGREGYFRGTDARGLVDLEVNLGSQRLTVKVTAMLEPVEVRTWAIEPGYDHEADPWPSPAGLVCGSCGQPTYVYSPDFDSAEPRHGSMSAS